MDNEQSVLWVIAIGAAMLFLVAVVAEGRRAKRRDPDRVGFMPWTLVQLASVLAAVFAVAMALARR